MTDETIFSQALALDDPTERAAFLDDACDGNPALRREVEALLDAAGDGEFLRRPAVEQLAGDATAAESTGPRDPLGFLEPARRPGALGRLGHYEVLEVLGRGAFGVVFRAFDEVLHRVVAVKCLAPELAVTSPARKRFLREARAAAGVRHDNVVQVHAIEEQPLPYLVMEFVPGQSLQGVLDKSGPLDVEEVVRIGIQLANGLAAAHDQGLVHRDVKPANVLVAPGTEGRVKLTDFGLARAADDASLTRSGVIPGTPLYMAPEQARGEAVDARSDLFSLGSVLYALLTGHPPFRAGTTYAVLRRVAEDTPRPIRDAIPEVPDWLCAVVEKLLAKDPADRFQTGREVAEALAAQKPVPRQPKARRPRRSLRIFWWVAALVFVALFFVLRADVVQRSPMPRPAPLPVPAARLNPADAAARQRQWAERLGVPAGVTTALNLELRLIPPGEAFVGSSVSEVDSLLDVVPALKDAPDAVKGEVRTEAPGRQVRIGRPYYLGAREVTVGQFRAFAADARYKTVAEKGQGGLTWDDDAKKWVRRADHVWSNKAFAPSDDHPVVFVTLADADAFCAWLGKKDGFRYAVATEDEWEFACRAGTTTRWYFGDDAAFLAAHGWALPGSDGRLHPVGQRAASPFGLYDLYGNAAELTRNGAGLAVARGGSAFGGPFLARSASRVPVMPDGEATDRYGFRVVREVP